MNKLSLSIIVLLMLNASLVLVFALPTDIPILRPAAPLNTEEGTTEDSDTVVVEAAAAAATTTIDGILVAENNENGNGGSSSVVKEFDPNDCFLMKERGPCRAAIDSWFFNVGTKSCENFSWSGCGGNKNRFPDQSTCETHCSKPFAAGNSSTTTSTPAAIPDSKQSTESTSTTAAGTSKATTTTTAKPKLPICPKFDGCPSKCVIIQDRSDRGCKKCLCGSATNDDSSKQQIPSNIQVSSGNVTVGSVSGDPSASTEEEDVPIVGTPAEVCQLPAKRGHCRAMQTRYRYDSKIKDCVQFHYGGCDANPNNFVSKDKCVEYCKGQ